MKRAKAESQIGQLIGYLSIPIGAAELFLGTPFSLIAGAIGLAMDRHATRRIDKLSWINFGLEQNARTKKKISD